MLQRRQMEFTALEQELGIILPMVNEANQIAQELKRKIKLSAKMHREIAARSDEIGASKTQIIVKVENGEEGYFYNWNPHTLEDRLHLMRNLINEYFDTNEMPDFSDKETDPFWDPPQPIQIGVSFLSLKALSYVFECDTPVKIFSSEGTSAVRGQLSCSYWPSDEAGTGEPDDSMMIDDEQSPFDLVGKNLYFRVEILRADSLPPELCKDTFVTYELKCEPGILFKTKEVRSGKDWAEYDYKQVHSIAPVTEYFVDWLMKEQVSAPCGAAELYYYSIDHIQGLGQPDALQ